MTLAIWAHDTDAQRAEQQLSTASAQTRASDHRFGLICDMFAFPSCSRLALSRRSPRVVFRGSIISPFAQKNGIDTRGGRCLEVFSANRSGAGTGRFLRKLRLVSQTCSHQGQPGGKIRKSKYVSAHSAPEYNNFILKKFD
jgi:hypothetical protein